MLPDRMPLQCTANNYALHVICKYISGDPKKPKRMNHSNEQILLPGIREKFQIAFPAIVADHGKAGSSKPATGLCFNIHKSPIHLEDGARFCSISPAACTQSLYRPVLGWQQVLVSRDIFLDGTETPREAFVS